jgi:4-amino-4-deoxy-L-arabinose transferase-like glycosyltransferase
MSAGGAARGRPAPGFGLLLAILAALTLARIAGLAVSSVDLFFDEAQYWAWSRDLAFGYFSKPPLLAWTIAAFDQACGSSEFCVRLASPLFYLGTSLVVYAIADELYGKEAAFWSGLVFALLTGVTFSTRIISTDVPLLLFWAVALLAWLKLLAGPDWRWALVLGIALGLGMLAKYAMAYFLLGMAVAAWGDRGARAVLLRPQTWLAFALALLILSPNIYWNAANEFATLRHTGENITGTGLRFRPLEALAFFGSQFAVAGPLVFAAFLVILLRMLREPQRRQDRLMLAFAIPPLALVFALSFFRGANANWAAPALLSLTVLVTAWWLRAGYRAWLHATLAIGILVQGALLVGDAFADRIHIAALGRNADVYQRSLGWRSFSEAVTRLAQENGAPSVAAEGRAEVAALTYYLRRQPLAVLSWGRGAEAGNHFDLTQPVTDAAQEPLLLFTGCRSVARLARFYDSVTTLADLNVKTGPSSTRRYAVFRLAGRHRPIGPLAPCD